MHVASLATLSDLNNSHARSRAYSLKLHAHGAIFRRPRLHNAATSWAAFFKFQRYKSVTTLCSQLEETTHLSHQCSRKGCDIYGSAGKHLKSRNKVEWQACVSTFTSVIG
jgi:hypothetical protein